MGLIDSTPIIRMAHTIVPDPPSEIQHCRAGPLYVGSHYNASRYRSQHRYSVYETELCIVDAKQTDHDSSELERTVKDYTGTHRCLMKQTLASEIPGTIPRHL